MAGSSLITALRAGLTRKSYYPQGALPARSSFWGMLREPFAGAWQQGVTVDPMGALTSFGAVYACITRIATDIAKLELKLVVEDEDDISVEESDASPYWRVLRKPNAYQNRIQWLTHWIVSKLMFGNAYQLKQRNDLRGLVTALYPLDPRRVTPLVTPDGDVYYSLGGDDLAQVSGGVVVPASEIIHDRGVTLWHPLIGVSPIYACGVSATQGMRIQRNSAQFFENMSRPSGMLTAPGTISEVTALRLKSDWEQNYSKENIGRLAIAGDGLKYEAMTIPAEASQMIEQLNWTVEDVARAFNVPAYKIGTGPMPSNDNVEALESQYYSGCLQILIESVELGLTEGLEVKAGNEVELELEGLLRMDTASQIDMLVKAAGGAIMKPNEARAKRNMRPVQGGDTIYLQQQNYSLEALAKRDARPDPFGTAKPPAAPVAPPAPAAPTPAPAPTLQAIDVETLARKAVEDVRLEILAAIAERSSAAAEASRLERETLLSSARAEIGKAIDARIDEVRGALPDLIEQAVPAPAAASGAPEASAFEALALELAARFAAEEPVCG